MKNKKSLGYISAIAAASLMGTIGVFVRNISSNAQIITFSRLFVSFLFLILLLFLSRRGKEVKVKLSFPLVLSGVFMALAILFYIESIKHTTLSNAVLLLYIGPLFAIGLAHFFLKERVKPINVVLMIIAFSGLAILLGLDSSFNLERNLGFVFGIISGIWYSFYIVANRKIEEKISIATRSFYQFFFGSIVILPFLFFGKTGFIVQDIPYLILIGFINGFLALTFLIFALKNLKTFEFGTMLYIEPIIATILGWLIFSEMITVSQLIGGIMILGSGIAQIVFSIKVHGE